MFKQKTKLLALCFVFLFSIASTAMLFAPTAKALYTVPAGQMCDDKTTTPTRSVDNGVATYTCDDATRTGAGTAGPGAGGTGTAAPSGTDSTSTCAIEGVGIVICGWLRAIARISDELFNVLANYFLAIEPELFNDESPTRDAWEQARNLANVVFVIAFVVLIYSQITGGLMSNYGIKRMLPRLIIVALAVNLSYILCQGLIDASNILGYNIKDAMSTLTKDLPPVMGSSSRVQTGGGSLSNIIAAVAGVAILAWPVLSMGMAIITGVLVTVITTVLILLIRKAVLVLFVVVSPLIFVAYLLPNTEGIAKKGVKAAVELAMVFPMIAFALGIGELAGGIVLNSNIQGNSTQTATQRACPEGKICAEDGFAVGGETQMYDTGRGQAPASSGILAAGIFAAAAALALKLARDALKALGSAAATTVNAMQKGTRSGITDAGGFVKKRWDNSDVAKRRAHEAHHRDIQTRAGTFRGSKILHPIKRGQSRINKEIRTGRLGRHPYLKGLKEWKDNDALNLRQKEASDSVKNFEGDADLMRIWNATHGDISAAQAYATANGLDFGDERKRAFQTMAGAGLNHSAGSYMAAMDGMIGAGKGNISDVVEAVKAANHADPSVGTFGLFERARSAARKSGRADLLASLEKMKKTGYDMNRMSATDTAASQTQIAGEMSNVGVGALHYEMFKDSNPEYHKNLDAFLDRAKDSTNIYGAIKGLMSADGRVAGSVDKRSGKSLEAAIMEEALTQARLKDPTRAPSGGFTSLQDAANFFENRKG